MRNEKSETPTLPYRDPKPVGAGDFYFAINATFRFIQQRLGMDGLTLGGNSALAILLQ